MANTLLTIDKITRRALIVLHNNLAFARSVDRQYDPEFAVSGAKIGDALRIRKPPQYSVTSGAALSVQDYVDEQVTLTLNQQKHIDVEWTSKELTLEMDEFSDRYLEPAMARLASEIDADGLALYTEVFNQVGTPGTTPATAQIWLDAGAKLSDFATPKDINRHAILNPKAEARTVDNLKGLFQQSTAIGQQYASGDMGRALGFMFAMDQNVQRHTTGTFAGTTLVDDTVAEGDAVITIDAFTSATPNIKAGDVFTIAGVNSVNPETKQDTGELQQFVVTAEVTGASNEVTVAVAPAMYSSASGARQTITALPANNAAVTWAGTQSTAYPINMTHHRDAFTLGTADLVMPGGVDIASRQVFEGISMRVVRQYDINTDKFPVRLDVLYGWKSQRPSMACRVIG